ncbi:MAG: hypothetical protein K2J64_08560 [Desulfovibrio sp.]|nr:hypothetical protein [Desulfovibrio sp.]
MLIMVTLGAMFPRIWEADYPIKNAYFSTEYRIQRAALELILKNFSNRRGDYAIGCYSEWRVYAPRQNMDPSLLYVKTIEVLHQQKIVAGKKYDIKAEFIFLNKIDCVNIINIIKGSNPLPLFRFSSDIRLSKLVQRYDSVIKPSY